MDELWGDIKGFGNYQISTLGRVRNKLTEGLIKANGKRYLKVCLYTVGGYSTRKFKLVHRLVGEAFLEGVQGKLTINHKDGNKQNNHLTNLEWCTQSENQNHAYKTGLQKTVGIYHPLSKLTEQAVRDIRKMYATVPGRQLALKYNVTPRSVYLIQKGVTWKHVA